MRKHIWKDFEDMKEIVKNMFQDCKEPVLCIEKNTIGEDSGFKEEMKNKSANNGQ